MSTPWPELLDQVRSRYPTLLAFALDWWQYNAPFLARVQEIVPRGSSVLEVGTGTGALAVLLASHGYRVTGIDRDPAVIEGAKAFADHFHVDCTFEVADGFDLSAYSRRFDLAFSGGVIEHFERADAIRMLREKSRTAPQVLAVTPTWYALKNDPATGPSDARPMTHAKLRSLFAEAGLVVTRQFGYGIPDDGFSKLFRYGLPRPVQWWLQNRASYACTVACLGSSSVAPWRERVD